jgi:hypothetical protein
MALKEVPGDIQGAKNTVETIEMVPGEGAPVFTITGVFYGTNANGPISVPLNADKKSFSLTILPDSNVLQVTLFSKNKTDGCCAIAQQTSNGVSTPLEDDIEFVQGVAVWSPIIAGV